MAKNTNLHKAKKEKNDEFYTQLSDIEREIAHYDNAHFKDRVVLCNCNDGVSSKFWEYFHKNFKLKGLKKLIGISYALHEGEHGKAYIYDGGTTADSDMDLNSCVEKELRGRGDFREEECIEYLKEADVVVTNPPFSLFREYVAQLMEHKKKFLIIGTINAIAYKEIFPLLKNNILRTGYKCFGGGMNMIYPPHLFDASKVKKYSVAPDGNYIINIMGVIWFTNLDIQKRHGKIVLCKNYTPEEYPHYDNYDAINVNKVADIPCDYDGVMGVPITFLDKYNPEQFEIVAFRKGEDGKDLVFRGKINGKETYARILIRKK